MEKIDMDIKIEKIIRTKRKTIALQLTDDAHLIIKAPLDVDDKKIMEVILKHKNWLEKKIKELSSRDPKFSPKEFVNGEGFLYLGKYYKLTIVDDQKEPLKFENGFFLSRNVLDRARDVFIEWYKSKALEKISERVKFYSQIGGFEYNKINITDAQKRWGSCSGKNLNFSWRLIMAPLPVIDYVVIHELAHLSEKNHGKSFWIKVKILMPNYEKYKYWLDENGHLLRLDGCLKSST
jgi:predicted metal-dependent hydrolase